MKRSVSGSHSWAIVKVKELESGELYPTAWRCRDCDVEKKISVMNRASYSFPAGHEQYFPEGLPRPGLAGRCPFAGDKPRPSTEWGEP